MKVNNEHISSREFAEFFAGKNLSDTIAEVFKVFAVGCVDFCNINPTELDGLIKKFNENKSDRLRTLTAIIELLRRARQSAPEDGGALAKKAERYIEEHLFENFSVEQMAGELNISFYYMCHLFKEYKGMSISSFKNKRRLQRAERMLVETKEKVTDIALRCGYDSASYFTEMFTKYALCSPTEFRRNLKDGRVYFPFYTDEDVCLANRMKSYKFLSSCVTENANVKTYSVHVPDEEYRFLHEAAVIEHKGVWFASWYNCRENELRGQTPVRGRRSADGGKSWGDIEVIDDDESGKIMFCPPVYGIDSGRLYMFVNEMVAPDHIHALNLYVLDEDADKFVKLWSRPIPFKLNTNVMTLPNGKLMISGRIGELDRFPNTPAVLISDSGKIDGEWRLVKIAENGDLPDGERFVHPEICPVITEGRIYMFCRNDRRRVPIIYISEDNAESWSGPFTHDIPLISSKMYAGRLTDGRCYIVGNIDKSDRGRLAVYFSKKDSLCFDRCVILSDTDKGAHYPAAYESGGKLYIIYSRNYAWEVRGAEIAVIDLEDVGQVNF